MLEISEKGALQGMKHKEDLERKELEKAATMLENLEKKRKAVEKFEKMKLKQQRDARVKNHEKN